jgi:hypothetical protein
MSQNTMKAVRAWSILALCTLVLTACSDKKAGKDDQTHAATDADGEYAVTDEGKPGFDLTLSEAEQTADELVRPRTVEGTPLSDAETERLLSRLPALPDEDKAQAEFAFRKRSKPAPRTGETVETSFPPSEDRQAPEAGQEGPLEVLRYSPEGEVELAPKLSITFSKPMVAVTGQQDAAETVPATIEPAVEGSWRWIGTRTALFEPDGERFPMATDYKVSVPSSLTSANGDKLDEGSSFGFSTPPVELTRAYPTRGPHIRQPLMFMEFNQRVDPEQLIDFIEVKADADTFEVTRASKEQLEEDDTVKRLVEQARPDQFITFRTTERLPAAANVRVSVKKGAPSSEGPKPTQTAQTESFRTYDPLRVQRHSCTSDRKCRPMTGWYISMNNTLDEESFSADMVRVEPEIPNMEVQVRRSSIHIDGQAKPRTTYEVTLDASLEDRYGQTLGEDTTIEMHVGPARPRLGSSAGIMTVLDPASNGHFPVFSVNYKKMRVRAFEVEPKHWPNYLAFVNQYRRTEQAKPPGKKVLDEEIAIAADEDEFNNTLVDLNEALGDDGHGQLLLIIEATEPDPDSETNGRRYHGADEVVTWVQSTDIALDAFADTSQLLVWASSLRDGEPLEQPPAKISLLSAETKTTGKDGLARLALPEPSAAKDLAHGNVLIAKRGSDVAILPERVSPWGRGQSNWKKSDQRPDLLWHVFDDRGMYKPGETVNLKGWLRLARPTQKDRLSQAGTEQIKYAVFGPRGNRLSTGKTDISRAGGFDFSVDLPDDVNLGHARITLGTSDGEYSGQTSHSFQIQEFRRPEFEVGVSTPTGPHVVGQSATATVDAKYYAGGGLAGAPVNWTVKTSEGQYTPPNRDDYIFGRWSPWWMPGNGSQSGSESFSGHTDAAGEHHLKVSFNAANPPLPTVVAPSASVTDVNRQTWGASASMLVHPAKAYVGIRSEDNFVAKDEHIEIEAIVTDIDGNLAEERPVEMSAARIDWQYKNGEWQEVEADKKTCTFTSSDAPQNCTFEPEKGGSWRITAITRDEQGRPSMSQMRVWVAGGERPPNRRAEQQEVELIPDKETYEAGDTAKILVQAPFADAEGLMTIRQHGLVSEQRFEVDGQSHTLEIPITEANYPNVHVQVDLVGSDARRNQAGEPLPEAGERPAFAKGAISLKVPPRS